MKTASVLLCFPYFRGLNRPNITGGTISNYHLVALLSKHYDVTVLSLDPDDQPDTSLDALDCQLIQTAQQFSGKLDWYRHWNDFVQSQVESAIDQYGIPSVFVSTTRTLFCNAMFNGSNVKTVGLIQAFENFGFHANGSRLKDRITYFKRDLLTQFKSADAIRHSDLMVTNSQYMRSEIQERFQAERIDVVYPSLDDEFLDSVDDAVPSQEKIVGFVNRNKGKNFKLVVELAKRMPHVQFLVFGTSPKKTYTSNLVYRGWAPDRVQMFLAAPLWLVPSSWPEPFGRVSIEAQAMGCEVLVSNRGGLPETVLNAHQIVTSSDASDWINAIESFFNAPSALPTAHRDKIRRKFCMAEAEQQWLESFEKLLASSPEPRTLTNAMS